MKLGYNDGSLLMSFLPWRVRRYLDDATLWSMQFRRSRAVRQVGGGDPAASLLAGGDIALNQEVHEAVRDRGPGAIFAPLKPILGGCDLRVANLESMLTRREGQPGTLGGVLKAPPESVAVLSAAGFDAHFGDREHPDRSMVNAQIGAS